jgi:hypothetical protein
MAGVVDRLPSYKKGGDVKKTGPAYLHKGEKVLKAEEKRAHHGHRGKGR